MNDPYILLEDDQCEDIEKVFSCIEKAAEIVGTVIRRMTDGLSIETGECLLCIWFHKNNRFTICGRLRINGTIVSVRTVSKGILPTQKILESDGWKAILKRAEETEKRLIKRSLC